ncbi:MAG: protein-export chaperone SecB [Pseudomonadota bacterium]
MSEPQQQSIFNVEKIYLKDLSLEIPHAPNVFLSGEQPQVEVQLRNEGAAISEGVYQVVLTVTVTAKAAEKTLFLVEVAQAGIFQIRNVPESDLEPLLATACPNILFPYVREAVSNIIVRAGFPPVYLAPVNFEALYLQRLQQTKGQAAPKIEIAH